MSFGFSPSLSGSRLRGTCCHSHCAIIVQCGVYFPLVHWQKGEDHSIILNPHLTSPECVGARLCDLQFPPSTANLNGHQVTNHSQLAGADNCVWLSCVTGVIAAVPSSVMAQVPVHQTFTARVWISQTFSTVMQSLSGASQLRTSLVWMLIMNDL